MSEEMVRWCRECKDDEGYIDALEASTTCEDSNGPSQGKADGSNIIVCAQAKDLSTAVFVCLCA